MIATKFKTIDEYITTFPEATKKILEEIRKTVKEVAPQAEEVISYNMPAIKLHGILAYYAAYGNHIGFYPTASGIETFKDQLSAYKWSKGAIQFPIDEPIPFDLIIKIVRFRVEEVLEKKSLKQKNKIVM